MADQTWTAARAHVFAHEWIEAWNAHDLERVLSHYAADIVFLSPVAQQRVSHGRVVGIPALRNYWGPALAQFTTLKFEFVDALLGHDCVTVLYRNQKGQSVAETCEFNAEGKVVRSFACYG